jgi:hypothetical protein
MPLATSKGITIPFPERLAEGYQIITRERGGYHLVVNIDGTRLDDVFRDLVELVPDPGFLILESPCNEVKELELRIAESDPFHRDIYYIDGLERYQLLAIFNEYSDLLVHDGFVHFGFGSHNTEEKNEVFVGAYKIVSIFTDDPSPYATVLADRKIPRVSKLTTAWDTFSEEHPGVRDRWSQDGIDIYSMIESLMRERGLYHAKTIKD